MSEKDWDPSIPRSMGTVKLDECCLVLVTEKKTRRPTYLKSLGAIVKTDGPRRIVCADCGAPIVDGIVFHLKPATYTLRLKGEDFYLERHIGIACGCAKKRGLLK